MAKKAPKQSKATPTKEAMEILGQFVYGKIRTSGTYLQMSMPYRDGDHVVVTDGIICLRWKTSAKLPSKELLPKNANPPSLKHLGIDKKRIWSKVPVAWPLRILPCNQAKCQHCMGVGKTYTDGAPVQCAACKDGDVIGNLIAVIRGLPPLDRRYLVALRDLGAKLFARNDGADNGAVKFTLRDDIDGLIMPIKWDMDV